MNTERIPTTVETDSPAQTESNMSDPNDKRSWPEEHPYAAAGLTGAAGLGAGIGGTLLVQGSREAAEGLIDAGASACIDTAAEGAIAGLADAVIDGVF